MTDVLDHSGTYDLESFNRQLQYCQSLDFYRDRLPESIGSWEEFRDLPLMDYADLVNDIQNNPPYGSLFHEKTTLTCLTPTGKDEILLEFMTKNDLDRIAKTEAEIFADLGLRSGDMVISCFSYTPFAGGYLFHIGLDELGVNTFPLGPGNASQTANVIETYDVDAILSAPSFALDIASNGGTDVDTIIAAGEPFSAIPGFKEEVRNAFEGATVVDYYGVSEVGPVAAERLDGEGMAVATNYLIVEVLDSATEEPVPLGDRGELVVTHLDRESQPLIRYRTGDLTVLSRDGDDLVLPRGVFGRVDDMMKIKGVKVYPSQLRLLLHGIDGVSGNANLQVDRPENTDRLSIYLEGDPAMIDEKELSGMIQSELLISPDTLEVVSSLDVDGLSIEDDRF